jgi:hypothetical protein
MREVEKRAIFPYRFRQLALIGWVVLALGLGTKTILDLKQTAVLSVSAPNPLRTQMTIVDDQFTVSNGKYWHQRFDILRNWKNVRILGKFNSASTTSKGVEMFLVTQEGFEGFTQNLPHSTLGASGQTTSGTINQQLDAGAYFLVIDNTADSDSDKAVNASVKG